MLFNVEIVSTVFVSFLIALTQKIARFKNRNRKKYAQTENLVRNKNVSLKPPASIMDVPGLSLFQGAESLQINTSTQQRIEEQDAFEDQQRRNEEVNKQKN